MRPPAAFRARALLAVVVASGALGGCRGGSESVAQPARPERLDGTWTIQFRLGRSIQLTLDPARVGPVSGRVTLGESDGADVRGLDGPSTHFGAYAADLRSFGFAPDRGGPVPPAAARLAGDTVEMVLGAGDAPLVMTGRIVGDSVAGAWRFTGDRATGSAAGTFSMARVARTSP